MIAELTAAQIETICRALLVYRTHLAASLEYAPPPTQARDRAEIVRINDLLTGLRSRQEGGA